MPVERTEQVCLDERQHAAVLALPLARAFAAAAIGVFAFWLGWPYSLAGPILVAAGALIALRAVAAWDRTRVVVTSEKIVFEHGFVRRRATAVPLERLPFVEVERSLTGRLFGYGTIVAGDLEITHVPDAGRVYAFSGDAVHSRARPRSAA